MPKTKLEKYQDYWERCSALPHFEFNAPCCGQLLKTRRPEEGENWDTMCQCVHCDELFHLDLTRDGMRISYQVPEARRK